MIQSHLGEIIALGTAICWTATALAFQEATRGVGSLSVNIFRLLIAFLLFGSISVFIRGEFIPTDASLHNWTWLTISGFIGFVLGDYFLFKSYETITARISMLVMAINPLFAAIISLFALNESMSFIEILAMFITLSGIAMVILQRNNKEGTEKLSKQLLKFSFPLKGLLFALAGAVGQAAGLVLSKYGMEGYDAFASTHIRVIAGLFGFLLIILLGNRWKHIGRSFQNKRAMKYILIGAIFGPFMGVYLSLLSVQYTQVGIASTIMSIVPVLIIPPAILIYKEKVRWHEIVGAVIAVAGISLFFING